MARKGLSDAGVRALKPRAKQFVFPDPELTGHYIRVMPAGTKAYVVVARDLAGKQKWATIATVDRMPIAEARERARTALTRIQEGKPAFETAATAETVQDVAEGWLKRHVAEKGLRSEGEIRRLLKAHVFPAWGARPLVDVRRSDVARLLDEVSDDHGARQADYVLALVRSIMNWHATRSDDYSPPIVQGMRRTNPKERARSRTLSDDELRAVWTVAEGDGAFGALVKLLVLTGQRRDKVAGMAWEDLDLEAGVWTIPAEAREKGAGGELKLPEAALAIVRGLPRVASSPFVFPGARRINGQETAMSGWSKRKRAFDAKVAVILPDVPQWQLHDLRRTGRSLMRRAGVLSEHAERVLGHVQPGVAGVYDRHAYFDEKAAALARLAALVDAIVREQTADVVPLARKEKRR